MADKFAKSHPWRLEVLRPFNQTIGALVAVCPRTGASAEIAPATVIPQAVGQRMFKTRRDAAEIAAAWRAEHGADVCGKPFKVTA